MTSHRAPFLFVVSFAVTSFARALAAQAHPLDTLSLTGPMTERPLAGRTLGEPPWFTHVESFNQGSPVQIGIDTARYPELGGVTCLVWVVPHRSRSEWIRNRVLADARVDGPQKILVEQRDYPHNIFTVDTGTLNGLSGTVHPGVGYDVVVDRDKDGLLDRDDWIDGWGDTAGFYVVSDLTLPGPYTSVEELYNFGGNFQRLDVYYPAEVAALGELPLVIVSHGNGHNYGWYDHIGKFLSSWGYVVVSHANNTGPGINAASTTTLSNTELFLGKLDVIANGLLQGHVDSHRMVWIGHSRGGEGVVRAYERLRAGDPLATLYTAADVQLLSSIAPTDFLGRSPASVPYHLWTGGADRDVNGCADCDLCQTFHLHERAEGPRMSISLHGVGHGDFHDGGGSSVAQGPCRVGRANTHQIMRGMLLPLLEHVLWQSPACTEYLWRQWEDLHPIGAPTSACVVVDLQFEEGPGAGSLVVDDFQSSFTPDLSSSGGSVSTSMSDLVEDLLNDANSSFSSDSTDPMNGMTQGGFGDTARGLVLQWDRADQWLLFELAGGPLDLRDQGFLSLRAAQATRDPLTAAALEDLTFAVRLWDAAGRSSTLSIGAYGGGIEEPYQRITCGTGTGWANEFETVRIPLLDFRGDPPLANQAAPPVLFDLGTVVALELLFGPGYGSPEGRIGLDDIEFTRP